MMMSRILIMRFESQGRTTAAIEPMIEPMTSAKDVAPRPMTSEYLAPYIILDNTSRPLSSVPKRKVPSGAWRAVKIS